MSGEQRGTYRENAAALAEAVRQAAERRRLAEERRLEALRRAAQARFESRAEQLRQRWESLGEAGFAPIVGYAQAALGRQLTQLRSLSADEIDQSLRQWDDRGALVDTAVGAVESLGERARAGAMAGLGEIGSDEDLRLAVRRTRGAGAEVDRYEDVIRRAREGLTFLEACTAAQVPLNNDVRQARARVEAFLAKPTLGASIGVEHEIASLRPAYLAARLAATRDAMLKSLTTLAEDDYGPTLEAWRPGFRATVETLRKTLAMGDWPASDAGFRELDTFFEARAEGRLRVLLEAAKASGLVPAEPQWNAQAGCWSATLSDRDGVLYAASELVPAWRSGAALDSTLAIRGPHNYDEPQCVVAGLRSITEQLSRQGVTLEIRGQTGQALIPAPAASPAHAASAAAPVRRTIQR